MTDIPDLSGISLDGIPLSPKAIPTPGIDADIKAIVKEAARTPTKAQALQKSYYERLNSAERPSRQKGTYSMQEIQKILPEIQEMVKNQESVRNCVIRLLATGQEFANKDIVQILKQAGNTKTSSGAVSAVVSSIKKSPLASLLKTKTSNGVHLICLNQKAAEILDYPTLMDLVDKRNPLTIRELKKKHPELEEVEQPLEVPEPETEQGTLPQTITVNVKFSPIKVIFSVEL